MKRKKLLSINWPVLIFVILVPYLLISVGKSFDFEQQARLAGLTLLVFGALILFISECNKNLREINKGNNKLFFLIGLALTLFIFISVVLPFSKDLIFFLQEGHLKKIGEIDRVKRIGTGAAFNYQTIRIDEVNYFLLYSSNSFHSGESVEISYLPNSRFILIIEHK